ncbi:MAG: acetyl-CoA carboxylase carboxyltransferase subunit beta [Gemmatimonadales bacterium]|nr:acetyl-CoA carboxylase carboxyltransferase subunit beta [Gemmatimonadales bacterium]NIN11666.1 acetyl-CoA carboxylase carboxyltransferase subunit beta [Gemmatimonadales bacterium]NIN50272.1 acetyl-CoA carboxylase carboxyltransferase subunit beta [Gemmatimonadales bacterium]NIP07736.1 acetyl-CoA carboxylase carboxyltransferase subunit beta [Gemmatimonadales bacterium]NIQ99139.1 acetyl-CoA carboxylase carboxyltransferase subunit beta [Gemmatimonadales bacterium]
MAWFRKDRRRRTAQREKLEIPADAWDKCEVCGHVDISEKFERALQVCPGCGYHRRIPGRRYIELLTDAGSFTELFTDMRSADALQFEGYADRLVIAERKAGPQDAMVAGCGTLTGIEINIGAMEFAFMGGSMGSVVGEKVARLADRSVQRSAPLVLVSASGGARMQEGVLSLMQMAKTSAVMARLREAGTPYVSILTNPTTGGVSASYAMQGDVNLAEPGAVIGFAGPRVIKQTIGQDLPKGFQTAEFLVEHGMVDAVVPRPQLRDTTARLLRMMQGLEPAGAAT